MESVVPLCVPVCANWLHTQSSDCFCFFFHVFLQGMRVGIPEFAKIAKFCTLICIGKNVTIK